MNLSQKQQQALKHYCDILMEWNQIHNLTAIREPEKIWVRHFEDSLASIALIHDSGRLIDLGTGAGLPGIPIALLRPNLEVILVESRRKKVVFCQEVITQLKLHNIKAFWGRAEEVVSQLGQFDVVISRATWALREFIRVGAPYLKKGGQLMAMKGAKAAEEIKEAQAALHQFKLHVAEQPSYTLSDGSGGVLVVIKA